MRYFPALLFLEYCAGLPAALNEFFWTSIYSKPEDGRRHLLMTLKGGSAVSLTYNGQYFCLFGWEKGVRFPSAEYQEPVFRVTLSRETRQVPIPGGYPPRYKYTFTPELIGERKTLSPYLKDAFIRINGIFSDYLSEKNIFDPIALDNAGGIELLTMPWERLMYGAGWRNKKPAIEKFCSTQTVTSDESQKISVEDCILRLTNS